MIHGLLINTPKNHCSIYESGLDIKNILKSDKYNLDYLETSYNNLSYYGYDFYVINWHHLALPIPIEVIEKLSGVKIGIVFETREDNIFEMTPDIFDAYMVIDPTIKQTDRIFPFPRPLEVVDNLRPLLREDIPVIGSFGLFTGGKRFDEIVEVCNNMNKEVIIRINIPNGTFVKVDPNVIKYYIEYLKKLARPNVHIIFTNEYKTKEELIRWLSEHTVNVFPYYRTQTGLCATVDQALSAYRPIITTNDPTFRHLRKYIDFYPHQTYEELILSTPPGIEQMNKDWSKENFNLKFEELLTEKGN